VSLISGMVLFTLDLDPTLIAYAIEQQLTGRNGKPSGDRSSRRQSRTHMVNNPLTISWRLSRLFRDVSSWSNRLDYFIRNFDVQGALQGK
jgi:hypothetical protein